jgi:hypothetical protein
MVELVVSEAANRTFAGRILTFARRIMSSTGTLAAFRDKKSPELLKSRTPIPCTPTYPGSWTSRKPGLKKERLSRQ